MINLVLEVFFLTMGIFLVLLAQDAIAAEVWEAGFVLSTLAALFLVFFIYVMVTDICRWVKENC